MEFNQQLLVDALKVEYQHQQIPFSLHIFDSLPSTNQTLWQLLSQGEKPGTVVIATQQTAGKGQWGRQWLSNPGGLYLSLGIGCELPASASYHLTIATAWGITTQLRKLGITLGIKWPNDLILDGCKLGGILTETKVNQGLISQAVIGVGINWQNSVPETGINLEFWQNSHNFHYVNHLEILAAQVLLGIQSGIDYLKREGINIILSGYLDLLTNMGDHVYVNNLLGTVVGVTQEGNLQLQMTNDDSTSDLGTDFLIKPGQISLGYQKPSTKIR
ncbi:biotin--[acetyl-CoA-carboxylase] ligase [Anabaena sp. FACHB-1237]|uniref:biotin--[acetyl-CoA-carboxylase] ligase n=1 Tax=Anabaena sp. FACHB-1237 TaxID=2692769 RepID=UPI00168075E6|nr:biotin--[acetyl-CoA-carboxylase] ligase [Anabaena sp. FACHB-1237]MBD2136534.1 biotin--[acetyl-CoA-carboxylase] ligase [Anabaena sp. FACHB-1237]